MARPEPQLLVATAHRAECTFGPGFYRISLIDQGKRYCQNQEQVELAVSLLSREQIVRVERDGFCLDGMRVGDANTPDVVDAETWLGMPRDAAMTLVGLESEADYARVYQQVSDAVHTRDNRQAQDGIHVPIVIKKRGRKVIDVTLESA